MNSIEKRLSALERQVAQLKAARSSASTSHPIQTLEKIHGTFEDDEASRTAMRLGRRWRESQRPAGGKARAKSK